jgi:hypothetical protein
LANRTWRVVIAVYPKPWWEPEYDFWNPLRPYWRQRVTADASFVRKICWLVCFVDDIRCRRWQERKRSWAEGRLPFGKHFRESFNALMVREYTELQEKQRATDAFVEKAVTAHLAGETQREGPNSMLDLPITLGPFHGSLN